MSTQAALLGSQCDPCFPQFDCNGNGAQELAKTAEHSFLEVDSEENIKEKIKSRKCMFHKGRCLHLEHLQGDVAESELQEMLSDFPVSNITLSPWTSSACVELHNPEVLEEWDGDRIFLLRDQSVFVTPSATENVLCVASLPLDYSEEQFARLVKWYGSVQRCFLMISDKTGKSKGYGFVKYQSQELSLQAKHSLNGKLVDGHIIVCGWLSFNHLTYKSLHSKCLHVERLPKNYYDMIELKELFSSVAKPIYCQVALKKFCMQDWGMVEYSNYQDAEATHTLLNGYNLHGHNIKISYYIPGVQPLINYLQMVCETGPMNTSKGLLPQPTWTIRDLSKLTSMPKWPQRKPILTPPSAVDISESPQVRLSKDIGQAPLSPLPCKTSHVLKPTRLAPSRTTKIQLSNPTISLYPSHRLNLRSTKDKKTLGQPTLKEELENTPAHWAVFPDGQPIDPKRPPNTTVQAPFTSVPPPSKAQSLTATSNPSDLQILQQVSQPPPPTPPSQNFPYSPISPSPRPSWVGRQPSSPSSNFPYSPLTPTPGRFWPSQHSTPSSQNLPFSLLNASPRPSWERQHPPSASSNFPYSPVTPSLGPYWASQPPPPTPPSQNFPYSPISPSPRPSWAGRQPSSPSPTFPYSPPSRLPEPYWASQPTPSPSPTLPYSPVTPSTGSSWASQRPPSTSPNFPYSPITSSTGSSWASQRPPSTSPNFPYSPITPSTDGSPWASQLSASPSSNFPYSPTSQPPGSYWASQLIPSPTFPYIPFQSPLTLGSEAQYMTHIPHFLFTSHIPVPMWASWFLTPFQQSMISSTDPLGSSSQPNHMATSVSQKRKATCREDHSSDESNPGQPSQDLPFSYSKRKRTN